MGTDALAGHEGRRGGDDAGRGRELGADVAAGYRAATGSVAVADRSHRIRLVLRGRAPEQVLAGLVSGTVPAPLSAGGPGLWRGRAEASALLTAKGRMVTELRVLRAGPEPEDGFLLDLPREGIEDTLAHLRRFVPPRLAVATDVSDATSMITVLGPGGPALLGRADLGAGIDAPALEALAEGDLLHRVAGSGGAAVTVVRTAEVATPALDLLAPLETLRRLLALLSGAGAHPAEAETWEILRVEAGRPAYGADMDEGTLPPEAGIHPRVVDYRKGCFTGQEVLIRIRDRGHVNRLLRGLRMGQAPPPARGTPLFRPGQDRAVGHVTSAVRSPRFGEVVGLGYVRREVEPPAELRLGGPEGGRVGVHDLAADWGPP